MSVKKPFFRSFVCLLFIFACKLSPAQTIGSFTSVAPTAQTQQLVLPTTHLFQRIIRSGDALSFGGTVGANLDFTGYVPVSGSSRNGYLSISSETTPAGCAVLQTTFNNSTHTWNLISGGNVNFPSADIGEVSRFCSGTVTPNNTIIVCEEDVSGIDNNGDGYIDRGWAIEINPATRTVINQDATGGADKLWAMGRTNRENVAIKSDNRTIYSGADDPALGFIYKFVSAVTGNYSSGTLYVLQTTAALGNGTWRPIANTTLTEKNNIRTASTAAAAYNFNGVEDVEIGPDGRIYFSAKAEGKIYRFTDNGTVGTATDISGLEVFAGNSTSGITYDVNGALPGGVEPWGIGNDNLAFDGEGNLWVLQDGDRNHIWVIGPAHTQSTPQVRLFATTPAGSEPTGITFTPDYKFMFLSFQHPASGNTLSQTDAANIPVVFSTHTTVVVARFENLGPLATLPVRFTAFDIRKTGLANQINWSVADINNHDYFAVERSVNGTSFQTIQILDEDIDGIPFLSLAATDNNPPSVQTLYYRIKQCSRSGQCIYSDIKTIRQAQQDNKLIIYPQPVLNNLTIRFHSATNGPVSVAISDLSGKIIKTGNYNLAAGSSSITIDAGSLPPGFYLVAAKTVSGIFRQEFIKGKTD